MPNKSLIGCWLLGLLPGLLIGYLAAHWLGRESASLLEVQAKTLALQSEGLAKLKTELELKDTQLVTQQGALDQLRQTIKDQEAQIQEDKRQLAFFERIMRPSGDQVGVVIDNLTLEPSALPDRVHYRLALIQPARLKEEFSGQVEIKVTGSQGGEARVLSGRELGMKAGEMRYSLRYFQLLEGEWQLPEGFVPEQISIILPAAGRQPVQQLSTKWVEVLKPAPATPVQLPTG